jgi:hypothetical protein
LDTSFPISLPFVKASLFYLKRKKKEKKRMVFFTVIQVSDKCTHPPREGGQRPSACISSDGLFQCPPWTENSVPSPEKSHEGLILSDPLLTIPHFHPHAQ